MTSLAPGGTYRTAAQVRRRRGVGHVLTYLAAILVGLFAVFPLYWMVLTSVKPQSEITTPTPVWWPTTFVFDRYPYVLDLGFTTYLRNSLLVAIGTTLLGVVVATFAGYALARFKMPLRKYLVLMILTTQLFPLVVLLIPLFIVMRNPGAAGQPVASDPTAGRASPPRRSSPGSRPGTSS